MRGRVPPTTERFLEELSRTLDIEKTMDKLGISRDEARSMLRGLLGRGEKASGGSAYELYVDGASRGNPGASGAGAVIKDPEGNVVKTLKLYLGVQTNNRAEYNALILGLEEARAMGLKMLKVFADSELMVKQLNGEYAVRNKDLKPLFDRVNTLLHGLEKASIKHIPREENTLADGLANDAIDSLGD